MSPFRLPVFCALAFFAAFAAAEPASPDFDKAMAELKAASPELEAECAKLNADLIPLAPYDSYDSTLPDVSPSELAEYNRRLHELQDHGSEIESRLAFSEADKNNFNYIYSFIFERVERLSTHDLPAHFHRDAAQLRDLETRTAALEADVKTAGADKTALRARLEALNQEGTQVWNAVHADTLNLDDNPDGNGSDKGADQAQANPLQARLAGLSRRLQALDAALNGQARQRRLSDAESVSAAMRGRMYDPFGNSSDADNAAVAVAAVPGRESLVTGAAGVASLAQGARTLLDAAVPVPAMIAQAGLKPPVNENANKTEDAAPKETARVDALRAAGRTRTIGGPDSRAAYAFHQTGNTCGIGAQVEVLAIASGTPLKNDQLRAAEDKLYARAVSLGYFTGSPGDPKRRDDGGTPFQYLGDLLDAPVTKQYAASDAALLGAVKTGRVVLVNVDAGRFYNDVSLRGQGHSVAVTGAELGPSGKLLGYYVNDTGTGEGARFVDASQFLAAWKGFGSTLVVPQ